MAVVDLRNDQSNDASKGIIDIINAAAKAKTSQVELQQKVMIDQLNRQRTREDKKLEQQDEIQNWGKMFGSESAPQGNPETNVSGMANSATPAQVGDNPSAQLPAASLPGMPKQGETPMSSAFPITGGDARPQQPNIGAPIDKSRPMLDNNDGSFSTERSITIRGGSGKYMNIPTIINGKQVSPEQAIQYAKSTGQNLGIFDTQEEAVAAAQNRSKQIGMERGGEFQASKSTPQQSGPSSQYTELGFTPIGLGQLGMARKGKPEPKDYAYVQALNKVKQGTASPGEIALIKEFNGVKDTSAQILPGIDTVNLSPEMIQETLKARNPAHFNYLNSVKDGNIDLGGRSTKEMNKVMEEVQALWPGTNITMVKSRVATRKDFTSGKESQNIKALNTAIGHLDALHKIIPDLHNTDASMWNASAQAMSNATGLGLNPAIKRFQFTKNALAGELATVFKASGGTDQEIKNIANTISQADSPKNLEAVTKSAVDLLNSRLGAIENKWTNTFFLPDDKPFPVLSDKSRDIVSRIGDSNVGGGNEKTYAGLTIKEAKEQGFTGFDTEKNQWVK